MQIYKVLLSECIEREIDRIFYFIEETVSTASANRVINKIWQSIFVLNRFPYRGMEFEPCPGVRICSVKKYKYYLIYEVDDKAKIVTVHHVAHQHQDLNQFVLS